MYNILVAVADYPDINGKTSMMYVRMRNMYYIQNGIDVTVLNFATKQNYIIDKIRVISLNSYKKQISHYDALIIHASNIRNHYLFLIRYGKKFSKLIFFYHGHEVLAVNKVYPKPYPYIRYSIIKNFLQNCYDSFKLCLWRHYIPKVIYKSYFIFVSQWMYREFIKYVRLPESMLDNHFSIIYNSVDKIFEEQVFDNLRNKKYDFITIRANLDGSKYAIDIVNKIAQNTPTGKFLVVGKGNFFKYYLKADNITWLDKVLTHDEIISLLQESRFALMPTRTDAQGVMMCEMAAFGIPVITSDIPVCREIFGNFANVTYIHNDDTNLSLRKYVCQQSQSIKDMRYSAEFTMNKEVNIIDEIVVKDNI